MTNTTSGIYFFTRQLKLSFKIGSALGAAFFIFGFTSAVQAYTVPQYETRFDGKYYLLSQTFTKAKSPYLLPGGCANSTLPSYATLTIEAGAVVKFATAQYCNGGTPPTGLIVNGTLLVNGTAAEPVVFTSYKDDSSGGDTFGDGNATIPQPGDWGAVRINAAPSTTIQIVNAIFKYGGQLYSGELRMDSGTNIVLHSLEFASSTSFGIYTGIPLTIDQSSFHNNIGGAILADLFWNPVVTAYNNWWGDDSGPKVPSNPGGVGQTFIGNVQYDPWIGKKVNVPPTLGVVGVPSGVSYLPAQPVFTVTYADANNDAPSNVIVVVNNVPYGMVRTVSSTNFVNGVQYSFATPTGTLSKGDYSFYFEASDGVVTTTLSTSDLHFTIKNIPVILIPGILGTEMKKGDEELWLDINKTIFSPSDAFMDPLVLNQNGVPNDSNVQNGDVLRERSNVLVSFHYFDLLISEFQNQNYQENTDLFVFPYDWRLDNKITSQKLKEKINAVLQQTGSIEVDLVAHSMGGLVAKQYIIDNGTRNIDKLVFVGTPQLGAPKAFKTLLVGDNFGVPLVLNPDEMKKLSQNMSSVYQLLPSQKYVQEFGSYFFNNFSQGYDFAATGDYLIGQGANSSLLANADIFHSSTLDNFAAPGVNVFNIVGCDAPTIGAIIRRNAYSEGSTSVADYDLREVPGDGTVPYVSALAVKADNRFYVTGADHSKMPSQEGIRQLIAQIVSDKVDSSALPTTIRTDSSKCVMKKGKLVSVHSPVKINAYDASGNHVGITADGIIEKEIPGSSYEDIGGDKFIYLPEDAAQNYNIQLAATATGTFSFRIVSVVDGQVNQTVLYSDVPIIQASRAQMTISDQSADAVLQFDKNGTGATTTVPASAVLDAKSSNDFTPPSTTIDLLGVRGSGDWFRSTVSVVLSAVDDNSGILSTSYSLDGGSIWQAYIGQFIVSNEGTSTILYKSIDTAGNRESEKKVVLRLDVTPPEATISFDPIKKDILIAGSDNISSVAVNDQGDDVLLADEAGNSTTLRFNEKDRRKSLKVQLKSIEYNGIELNSLSKNRFSFEWGFDKRSNLEKLEQNISVKGNFRLEAEYKPKQNVTVISGRDVELGKIREKLNGLVLFKMRTNKGILNYNF